MTDETSSMFPHEYMNKKTGSLNKSGRDDLANLSKNKKKIDEIMNSFEIKLD